jgi:hypothetical protein
MKKALKIIGITFLSLFALFLLIVLFLVIKSKVWANEFNSSINQEYVASSVAEDGNIYDEKVEEYILSQEDIDSIFFSPNEVSQILYNSLSDMLGENGVNVEEVYVIPSNKIWEVCALLNLESLRDSNIWLCANVTKDDMQTAQLYVTDIFLQGINVSNIYPPLLTNVNKGLAEALFTANENGFVGRVFENIEFQSDQLVIKGGLY